MMGKMVKNMIYFVVLLLVVLMSFGVCRQAILYPNKEPSWKLARDVFFEPYFMLYGEVFADGIDPPCGGGPNEPPCLTGHWITPTVMAIYLLVANILLINLLIAVFNNIFMEVNAISHQVWMFQRFTVVMEYEQKPILPPPFVCLCHLFLLVKYFKRKMKGIRETHDNGLKLFLEKEDMERLYDFEEECVEGYFAEKEYKLQKSTEERIKITSERVDNMLQKVEDINTKENNQTSSMQNLEFRLRKVEEASQDILAHLAVIHRFMATRTNEELPPIAIVHDRLRKSSERSDAPSDDSHISLIPARKKPVRSLTEVRSDAYIFDDGLHFEVRPVEEEDETSEHMDAFSNSVAGSRKQLNIIEPTMNQKCSSVSTPSSESLNDKEDDIQFSADDLAALSLEALRLRAAKRRRDSCGTGRRSSDGNADECIPLSRLGVVGRQVSQTHSEPDNSEHHAILANLPLRGAHPVERNVTFAETKIKVIPPNSTSGTASGSRAMLLAMHAGYTSITDELETVCGLLSPPRTPNLLSPPRPGQNAPPPQIGRKRHTSEMSNPEIALYIEKEHLRDAEESDYMLMENLIQRRYDEEQIENCAMPSYLTVVHETQEYFPSPQSIRALRRASAIEDDVIYTQGALNIRNSCDTKDIPSTSGNMASTDFAMRQNSADSNTTSDIVPFFNQQQLKRPSIIIDSSQLPIQKELKKAESKGSLHMQSETMC